MIKLSKALPKRMTEELMRFLAVRGEMPAQEFLKMVPRTRGDYLDFYPVAALLHAKYISTNSTNDEGKLAPTMQKLAVVLCQLMLPIGESFQIDGCARESWCNFAVNVFITSEGYLRLDELEQRKLERNRKRMDYVVSLVIAIFIAILSSNLANYFASERARNERTQQITECRASVSPNYTTPRGTAR